MNKKIPRLNKRDLTGQAKFVIRLPRETRGLLRGVNQFLNPSLSVIIAAVFAVVIIGFGEMWN